ncbi:DNA-3-methyladenine glycosylase family protein [[Clostridium] hylemonae]|uniref:DNA-(apurinic or apyrimidinic site) lyase n=1 Tax=[Clostridium] hylemonae DSM 15053 TaxID=553973 RepID=C0C648_9FIRM|nr:DNA glycosylase [[Clostridium] hylemonae]EEG72582.1 8-oxoguanine DNA-glycosylase (ogg) [[Clostridium] hylemonae DSM 15053]QEK16742.1 DNA-3-methyladenine glycosylase [[Clostridium] hylemonae DSM 15053]
MVTKETDNFNIEQICISGQCFRMEPIDGSTYSVVAGGRYVEITQEGKSCTFRCAEEEYESFWRHYFDLDEDYGAYIKNIDVKDDYLRSAALLGSGIRILRQDLWEMTASFLISQQNNITRIRRCISNICETYGEKRESASGRVYYTFPEPEALAELEEDALKECNLGYRSKYVVRTARSIAYGDVNLDHIRSLSYPEAKAELLKLYGVGDKVADCICLFGLHHLDAFPVDTHISQALKAHYRRGFPKRRYKGYRGVMQQYIFYYELNGKR